MQNQENRRRTIHFAELETGGLRIDCPRCHVPFTPHLGNLIAAKFACTNCKVSLSYRSSTGRTVRCPCCTSWRPMPSLTTLVCGGCDATVIHQKGDRSVKCFLCKHITHSQEANNVVSPFYQVVPPQVNRVVPPQVNRVVPPQINRRNRKASAETESTATSPYIPNPESTRTIVADYLARLAMREVKEDKTEPKNKKIRL